MAILKKVFRIILYIIGGLLVLYLALSLIFIPLICPWVIKSQVAKIIKHEVKVSSVSFNPFLWKLKIKGFQILDKEHQPMIGFDKFWVDVGFLRLLKKEYNVESLGIKGLQVNIVLLEDGEINLLKLMPNEPKSETRSETPKVQTDVPEQTDTPDNQKKPVETKIEKKKNLPLVMIDLISLDQGRISFTDKSVAPEFNTVLSDIDLKIINLSTLPDGKAEISFKAKINKKGLITEQVFIKPFAVPLSMEMMFELKDYFLDVLTPYVGKYTGREVKSGKLDLTMKYEIENNNINAKHKLLIKKFDFGGKVESKDALKLPFGLALALLKDSQDRIDISLPVDGDMSDPKFHYFHLLGQVARNFFFKIITKPFSFLVSALGSDVSEEDYGKINFMPGRADLLDEEKEKLRLISKALNERPSVALKILLCYDPVSDWRKMKTDVFEKEFAAGSKETTKGDNTVYQQMYEEHFGLPALWKLTKKYRLGKGGYDYAKINEEIKRQIIEQGAPQELELSALAQKRATAVHDFLISEGIDDKRLSYGKIEKVEGNADKVPLELELKVFANDQDSDENTALPAGAEENNL